VRNIQRKDYLNIVYFSLITRREKVAADFEFETVWLHVKNKLKVLKLAQLVYKLLCCYKWTDGELVSKIACWVAAWIKFSKNIHSPG